MDLVVISDVLAEVNRDLDVLGEQVKIFRPKWAEALAKSGASTDVAGGERLSDRVLFMSAFRFKPNSESKLSPSNQFNCYLVCSLLGRIKAARKAKKEADA